MADIPQALLDDLQKAKQAIVDYTLVNSKFTTLDKLQALEKTEVYPIDSWIKHLFEEDRARLAKEWGVDYYYVKVADGLEAGGDGWQRNQEFLFGTQMEQLMENTAYELELEWEDEGTEEKVLNHDYPVLTNSKNPEQVYTMKVREIIEFFYNYALETKTIGYHFDW